MLWRRRKTREHVVEQERLIWLAGKDGQWMDEMFYRMWIDLLRDGFDLLGMHGRFVEATKPTVQRQELNNGLIGFIPVAGEKNRALLASAVQSLRRTRYLGMVVTTEPCGRTLRYRGSRQQAIDNWRTIADGLVKTVVKSIATEAFGYYLEGSQVGYDKETRHLFRPSNELTKLGTPMDPHWVAEVGGFTIHILGDWDVIKRVRRKQGLTLLHMLQLRLNQELLEAVRQER